MKKPKADPSAVYRKALQHFEAQRFGPARALLRDLHRSYPQDTTVLRMLGAVSSEMNRHEEAIEHFSRVAELEPLPLNFFNLGKALQLMGNFDRALWAHETGLKMQPANVQLMQGRAATLKQLGRIDEALAAFRAILERNPNFLEAHVNFAGALYKAGMIPECLIHYQHADRLEPNNPRTLGGLVRVKLLLCDWHGLEDCTKRLLEAVDAGGKTYLLTILTISDDPEVHLRAARASVTGGSAAPSSHPSPRKSKAPRTKLRIGYISADFRQHPTSLLIVGMLESHDRSRFEIIAISTGPNDASDTRQRVANAVDQFLDVSDHQPPQVIGRIRELELDIVVDLMGHTMGAIDNLFQQRLAPVQVNFLGYPGTTGIEGIDYIVVDEFIATPLVCRNMTEAAAILPTCYQPNDPRRPLPERVGTRSDHGLPQDGLVFCCFNNTGKITPTVFAAWMRILTAVSNSVLWLYVPEPIAQDNLKAESKRRGVAPERLVFAHGMEHRQHLARYHHADLFLDTFPYGAHTTGSDSLWMGCPVLTIAGQSFPARVAGSLLRAVGLPELIVTSLEDYEHRAIAIARDPTRREGYRRHLEECRSTTALFDATVFANNLERAYLEMWQRHQAGSKKKAISVSKLLTSPT